MRAAQRARATQRRGGGRGGKTREDFKEVLEFERLWKNGVVIYT